MLKVYSTAEMCLTKTYQECDPLTIFYHLHFPCVFRVSRRFHDEWVGCKECFFKCIYIYIYIYMYIYIGTFLLIFMKKSCFYFFHFFFWWSINFPQQNINQSKTGSGDKNLSLELLSENVFLGILIVCSLKVLCIWGWSSENT